MLRWRPGDFPATPEVTTALRLQIELVFDPGCANVPEARENLAEACREADVPAVWTEWVSDDPDCPERLRSFGSPTILVNGEDVAPGPHPWTPREEGAGPRCRLYRDGDVMRYAPPLRRLREAITRALGPEVV